MKPNKQQDQSQLKWIADFIWNIADDRLRDVYVRGKYRDVILPFTVLRRLDAVLESTKQAVLERKKFLDTHKVAEQDGALRMAAGQPAHSRRAVAGVSVRGCHHSAPTILCSRPSVCSSSFRMSARICSSVRSGVGL